MYDEFPDPVEVTRTWVRKNRPDIADRFEIVVRDPAIVFLICIAFTAGKEHGETRLTSTREDQQEREQSADVSAGLRRITYACRDIGDGVERREATGRWHEGDVYGKRRFVSTHAGVRDIFLFDDEIVSDEPLEADK